jgi:CRP/FNR family transcriptional regulator
MSVDRTPRVDHPLFAHLNEARLAQLATWATRRSYRRGEIISLYGEVWPYLFLVDVGRVQAVKESSEGRQLFLLSLRPDDVFWGLAFFTDGAPSLATLMAQEDTRLLLWERTQVLPVLLESGETLWELCQLMVRRMQQASQIVEGLAFQPVAGRLARLILERYGATSATPVTRDLTLDEMAAMVGSTREMVCRLLYRFADENLIHVTRTEFELTNEEGLARLAE